MNVFRIYCGPCHGNRAQGGRGPDLTRANYASGSTDQELFQTVSNGIPGTGMPGFGEMGPDNVWRVIAFLQPIATNQAAVIPGDRSAGEKLFWGKGGCGNCHLVNNRGARWGPQLGRIGRERSLAHLRESLVAPDKDLASDFATITAVKRDGSRLVGVGDLDNFSVRIVDTGGNYASFSRDDLLSVKTEPRSLMPSYERTFSPAELDDVIAYLASLRGAEEKK